MFALAVIASILTLVLPGLGILRALTSAAMAAPASVAVIVSSATAASALGLPWNPLVPILAGALSWGLLDGWWLLRGRRAPKPMRRALPVSAVAGVSVGAVAIAWQLVAMMGSVSAVSQTFDGVFHLNAVRRILDMGDASMAAVGSLVSAPGEVGYYPAAWHAVASIVTMASGGDIVLASNALMLVVACLVWPAGVVALVRATTTAGPVGLFAAGALSAASIAFPMATASFGILLPYLLSVAMVPAALIVLASLLRRAVGCTPLSWTRTLVLGVVVALAIGSAHPQGVMVVIVLGMPLLIWTTCERGWSWYRGRRRDGSPARARALALTSALTVVAGVVSAVTFLRFRPSFGSSFWRADTDLPTATARVLSMTADGFEPSWLVAAAGVAALLVVLLATRNGWLVASWAWAAALAACAMGSHDEVWRYLWTGPWYSDPRRLAAIPVIVSVPILAVAIDEVARRAVVRHPGLRELTDAAAVLVSLALLAASALSPQATASRDGYADAYWRNGDLLSSGERTLLEEVSSIVPKGDVIAASPFDGGSLASAISDRTVTTTFFSSYRDGSIETITQRLDEIQSDPAVCDAAAAAQVRWVLDLDAGGIWDPDVHDGGLRRVGDVPEAADVVAHHGDAELLRLRPCLRTDGTLWH